MKKKGDSCHVTAIYAVSMATVVLHCFRGYRVAYVLGYGDQWVLNECGVFEHILVVAQLTQPGKK